MQFGKVMSVCDAHMWRMYLLLSSKSDDELKALKAGHPKAAKMELAREIVARFHGRVAADNEVAEWDRNHGGDKKGTVPDDAPAFTLEKGEGIPVVDALAETQLMESKSKARALIGQGGLYVDGERVTDMKHVLAPGVHAVRVGSKKWARITVR